jgi:hypothetical protein
MNRQTAAPSSKATSIRAFIGSAPGTSLEWYDFAICSAASALVFGKVFSPSSDPLAGTLLAFATCGVGYAARPMLMSGAYEPGDAAPAR